MCAVPRFHTEIAGKTRGGLCCTMKRAEGCAKIICSARQQLRSRSKRWPQCIKTGIPERVISSDAVVTSLPGVCTLQVSLAKARAVLVDLPTDESP